MNNRFFPLFLTLSLAALFCFGAAQGQSPVTATEVDENIPTYMSGAPESNPMFFFGRGTQGAEQRIYPYPLYDNLTNVKQNHSYKIVYLENEYVKIGISPELGGRLFSAVDKTNGYDFIYRQHVIKPALIGLTGAWISGGVEWNIPHHHRASTFSPVQYSVEEAPDGSKTVWVGELEIRHRMRWAVGYTLRPGSSVVECNIRISNTTPVENTMLCFANIAVHIDENYQVLFPPHTEKATGHSKRSFNQWPMINGVDMSWYKNNLGSASWFAVNDKDDFVAGYDHGREAGIFVVADHNIVQGKKFFTWGVGNMWDNILTDADGPYLEIMVGAYSDNQPDYSWMQSGEERSFNMSLIPFKGLGGMKNATLDAAVNLEVAGGKISYGFYTTKAFKGATVELKAGDRVLATRQVDIDPANPYIDRISLPKGVEEKDLRASISIDGNELVAYTPVILKQTPDPEGYREPGAPDSFENTEELFLAGQRIDQFHNPSLDADPYWEEVLKRDPGHIEANTGMGRLAFRDARWADAEGYFKKAADRLTMQFTISKDVEPFYYLGLAQRAQGKFDEAFTTIYKAAWKQEWKAPAYYALAEIASTQGDHAKALYLVGQSLDANAMNVRAYVLKSALLRVTGQQQEALEVVRFAQEKCDPLDVRLMAEEWLASGGASGAQVLFKTLQDHPINAEEIAATYMNAGLWGCGSKVLSGLVDATADRSKVSPLVYYYMGYFACQRGDEDKAAEYRAQAARQPMNYVFPFQYEIIPVLESAIAADPKDARAPYYLGNLLYDWQPARATALWERSAELDPNVAVVWRNLGIAYSHENTPDATKRAIAALGKAVALPNPHPTHLSELDGLYRSEKTTVATRLAMLEKNEVAVMKKDDALGSLINLEIFAGKPNEAIDRMKGRIFNLWEGGSAFNTGEGWANAWLVKGLQAFRAGDYKAALADLQTAIAPPDNLRAERASSRTAQIKYWIGAAYEAMGDKRNAQKTWRELVDPNTTAARSRRTTPAIIQTQRYFTTLAQQKLNPKADVGAFFTQLTDLENNTRVTGDGARDFQFVRVNTTLSADEMAYPHYLAGLGWLALGDKAKARSEFQTALAKSPDLLGPKIELDNIN